MADKLADYVVGIGVKGQNVALTEINKIKKAGKELTKQKTKINLTARKEVDTAKRKTQETQKQTAQLTTQQRLQQIGQRAGNAAATARDTASTAMTGSASGLAASIPYVGSLFAAAGNALANAAQQYINGITAGKNIQLVETAYTKAFKGATEKGTAAAISGGMFATRETKEFYADLVGGGAKAETLAKPENLKAFNDLAKAQGVGSLQELFGRIQSGALKEGKEFGGLTKTDIDIFQGYGDLLNNRYTRESGIQGLLRGIERRQSTIQGAATSSEAQALSSYVKTEGNIREGAQDFEQLAAATMGSSGYKRTRKNQLRDLKFSKKTQKFSEAIDDYTGEVKDQVGDFVDKLSKGKVTEAAAMMLPGYVSPEAKARAEERQAESQGLSPSNADAANKKIERFAEQTERATDAMRNFSNNANSYGRGVNTDTGY